MNAYMRFIEFFTKILDGKYDSDMKSRLGEFIAEFESLASPLFTDKEKILSDEEWLLVPKKIRLHALGLYAIEIHKWLCDIRNKVLLDCIFKK